MDEGADEKTADPQDAVTDDRECSGDDFVGPGPSLPDGSRVCVRHSADHSVRLGVMRSLESGRPLGEDDTLLEPREGTPFYDIVGSVADMKKGPSKVVTNAYRKGWDTVFSKKPDPAAN